jgi:hypothetical protein
MKAVKSRSIQAGSEMTVLDAPALDFRRFGL